MAKVSILMGSDSDLPVMSKAAAMLEGMQGVLDLQNVDSTTETIVFKKSETQKSTEENQNE